MNFRSLGLVSPILKTLDKQGLHVPTPIQEKSIPTILEGKDVIGLAQTGTGKTAAFILPLLSKLYRTQQTGKFRKVKLLVLSPTRELAQQIGEVVKPFASATNLKTCTIVGGIPIFKQFKDLRKGSDIIIGTPGRIEDHISQKSIDLSNVNYTVLDEADQMFDIGFLPAVKRILSITPKKRQTLLFSATMPTEIKKLVREFMVKAVEIAVSVTAKPIEKINQKIIMLNSAQKIDALKKIAQGRAGARLLVFTKTKHGAEKVVKSLSKDGFLVTSIHGNKSQNQRQKSLMNFKTGTFPLLVATDIAARGIDVPEVEAVINYDLPEVPESYVHRIGRTARAGMIGDAISFCSELEIKKLRAIEKLIKTKIKTENYHTIINTQIQESENNAPPKRIDYRRKRADALSQSKFRKKSSKKSIVRKRSSSK
ncbi:DEAD/DEAH box helicase [Paracoccaceae bacterium]|nr:DEAD/DEAH box helicase [Paracoccaceae bacterium]MDC3090524.1 DEAD/DEAH box helicase [Paracoccaceae bacterium]